MSGQLQSLAAAEVKSSTPTPVPSPATPTPAMGSVGAPSVTVSATTKPEMPRDADSDFAELNPLDDVDVSDQLIRKKEVGCWGVGVLEWRFRWLNCVGMSGENRTLEGGVEFRWRWGV